MASTRKTSSPRGRGESGRASGGAASDELAGLGLAQPAQRALRGAGYDTLAKLAQATDAELLALHGMGANALRKIRDRTAR
jgi:hypothetical protein